MIVKNIRFIVTMNPKREIINNGSVLIRGNSIEEVGDTKHICSKYKDEEILDAEGMVAIPGLVNSHTHSPMSLMRGYSDDLPLTEWLEKIWEIEKKLKPKDCYYGSMLACIEMIRFGVTTFSDMYFYPNEIKKAVEESGLRSVIAAPIFSNIRKDCNLINAKRFVKKKTERITPALGPHSPYACTREELFGVKQLSEENDALIHIHVSETKDEVKQVKEKYGMRPVEFLDSIGLLKNNSLLAHCVWLNKGEISSINRNSSKVVHCPTSNMKLASGVAPIKNMKDIIISLGSDGSCSNNNLDMFEEMKVAALLQKVSNLDSTLLPAKNALEMATINGAKSLGLSDIGSIEAGKRADLVLIDFRKSHLTPLYEPISNLVYSCNGNNVNTTICNGKILMKDRELKLDLGKIMKKAEEIKENLINK